MHSSSLAHVAEDRRKKTSFITCEHLVEGASARTDCYAVRHLGCLPLPARPCLIPTRLPEVLWRPRCLVRSVQLSVRAPAATLWTFALNVPRTLSPCACADRDRPASLRLSCAAFGCDVRAVSPASGISQMALDYVTYCTAEGDRIILELQCARFLVKVGVRMRARAADGAGWLGSLGKTTCALCGLACEQPPPGCL